MRRGTRREDAEDLIQDAFVRMQQYCERGGEVLEPEGFLVRVTQRLALNLHRDSRPSLYEEGDVDRLVQLIDTGATPDEELAAEQCLIRMRAMLNEPNPRTRDVFFMHRFDGLSQTEIAAKLGISVSAVEKHFATALAALAEASLRE